MGLIGSTVDTLQVTCVGRASRQDESDIGIFRRKFQEGIAVAKAAADDDVVATTDIFFCRCLGRRNFLGNFLHKGNIPAEMLFDSQP